MYEEFYAQIIADKSIVIMESFLPSIWGTVVNPRPLVDLAAATSSPLLINEAQWIGIIVRPIDYSLKGAVLHIDTGPGLMIEESHVIEMESYIEVSQHADDIANSNSALNDCSLADNKDFERLSLHDGRIQLPDWASNVTSILWIPVCAIDNNLARGSSTVNPQRQSIVDGMRTIALKLEFGVSHNQLFDRHSLFPSFFQISP
ncbi:hypothetical protein LWI29_029069 [Acer saccharum]|uniref:Uncharacterized protein n=1 Tax=Acer saccharum TaxID=4024 RepID=A0AA39SZQ4_ACESA|nr:hypothetical protein LWI29_029069 [Acer saccharum]